jgi:hypothetical protein
MNNCLNFLKATKDNKETANEVWGFLHSKEGDSLLDPLNLVGNDNPFWEGIDSSKYVYYTYRFDDDSILFDTKGSCINEDWMIKLSEKFPDVLFDLKYVEFEGDLYGHIQFKNGKVIFEDEELYSSETRARSFGRELYSRFNGM